MIEREDWPREKLLVWNAQLSHPDVIDGTDFLFLFLIFLKKNRITSRMIHSHSLATVRRAMAKGSIFVITV